MSILFTIRCDSHFIYCDTNIGQMNNILKTKERQNSEGYKCPFGKKPQCVPIINKHKIMWIATISGT